jgi:hypothetical protein
VLTAVVTSLLLLYASSDERTHLGAFYGNAIADWLGILVYVIATKYFFEVGSGESRQPSSHVHVRIGLFLIRHSLTLVLAATGLVWITMFARSDVDSKTGAVLGNIVSGWMQLLGLVLITKYASERGSKEGN